MYPVASVSGFYFSHPEARYFGLGAIGRDQIEALAQKEVKLWKPGSNGWHRIWTINHLNETSSQKNEIDCCNIADIQFFIY